VVKYDANIANRWRSMIQGNNSLYSWSYLDMFRGRFSGYNEYNERSILVSWCADYHSIDLLIRQSIKIHLYAASESEACMYWTRHAQQINQH